MTANPWDKWFWSDWDTAPDLKLCSLAAQGLWMRILSIMAKATPKGYLRVGNNDCRIEDIAQLVGHPVEEITTLLFELEFRGVFSKNKQGCIYNRRMVKEAKKYKESVEAGGRGGNPKLTKNYEGPGFLYLIGPRDDGAYKIGMSINPQKRLSKFRQQFRGQDLKLLRVAPVDEMHGEYTEIQRRMSKFESGEWLFLNSTSLCSVMEYFDTLKGQPEFTDKGSSGSNQKPEARIQKEIKKKIPPSPPQGGNGELPLGDRSGGKPKPETRATRWPAEQQIPADWVQDARDTLPSLERRGMGQIDLDVENLQFLNWAIGKGARYVDWRRTYLNWILNAAKRAPRRRA